MNQKEKIDLDNYITGHYGEDAFSPCEDIEILLARREKQLKRMITEARAWMESERACNKMFNELLNRFPEEQRAIDGEDAAGIIPYR